jgi:hypothetical protein
LLQNAISVGYSRKSENAHEETFGDAGVYVVIAMSGLCALGAESSVDKLLSLMLAQRFTLFHYPGHFSCRARDRQQHWAFFARQSSKSRVALGGCQLLIAGTAAWPLYYNKVYSLLADKCR